MEVVDMGYLNEARGKSNKSDPNNAKNVSDFMSLVSDKDEGDASTKPSPSIKPKSSLVDAIQHKISKKDEWGEITPPKISDPWDTPEKDDEIYQKHANANRQRDLLNKVHQQLKKRQKTSPPIPSTNPDRIKPELDEPYNKYDDPDHIGNFGKKSFTDQQVDDYKRNQYLAGHKPDKYSPMPDKLAGGFTNVGKHMFPKGYKKKSLKEFVTESVISPNSGFDKNRSNELRKRNVNMNNPLFKAKNAVVGGYNGIKQAVAPNTNILPNNSAKLTVGTNNLIAGRQYQSPEQTAARNTAYAPNSYDQGGNTNNLLNGQNLERQNADYIKQKQFNGKLQRSREVYKQNYENKIKPAIINAAKGIGKKIISRNYWRKDIKPGLNTIANAFRR